ncbi:hypothetical protein D0B54_04440 [Solimonas sp. K1W22B-7]|uniref:hypothetical protein n=1 Tax=Solimonas sp. K1W22B-7 TaxID=2303331 RepID=UPI000E3367F7|nr:hypothetical protein [Solimonas sp. K1W22B-7]AXQ27969.1 hypothetical protein D0B54_04440 [Solimonas sp. K1W22B-7]
MKTFSIGDLIVDNLGREGICLCPEKRPNRQWLAEQEDARMSQATGPWWNVLPVAGGAVIVPEDLGAFLRRATIDDVFQLMESQQSKHAGQYTLDELFQRLRSERAQARPAIPVERPRLRRGRS